MKFSSRMNTMKIVKKLQKTDRRAVFVRNWILTKAMNTQKKRKDRTTRDSNAGNINWRLRCTGWTAKPNAIVQVKQFIYFDLSGFLKRRLLIHFMDQSMVIGNICIWDITKKSRSAVYCTSKTYCRYKNVTQTLLSCIISNTIQTNNLNYLCSCWVMKHGFPTL